MSVNFLKNIGIENEEISVLFRLPKETGEKFNSFVKLNKLNNPIRCYIVIEIYKGEQMSVTLKNLESALSGESQAHVKYRYFAKLARAEGFEEVAEVSVFNANYLMKKLKEVRGLELPFNSEKPRKHECGPGRRLALSQTLGRQCHPRE